MVLSRHDPSGVVQGYARWYGTFPVGHAPGGLKDTVVDCDCVLESSSGFLFDEASVFGLVLGVQRSVAECNSWERERTSDDANPHRLTEPGLSNNIGARDAIVPVDALDERIGIVGSRAPGNPCQAPEKLCQRKCAIRQFVRRSSNIQAMDAWFQQGSFAESTASLAFHASAHKSDGGPRATPPLQPARDERHFTICLGTFGSTIVGPIRRSLPRRR